MASFASKVDAASVYDFESIAKAFEDPNSRQFTVREFGYCTNCNSVAEYEFYGSLEGTSETCLKCGASEGGSLGAQKRRLMLLREMVPFAVKSQIDTLHSRERQRRFFLELLDKKIADVTEGIAEARQMVQERKTNKASLESLKETVSKLEFA